LFAGSDRGAERAAVMAALILTARLNNIDPKAWLADVFARIADMPQKPAARVVAVELDASRVGILRSGGVIMHVNKVHSVTTIGRVAKDLGQDEDWLWDVANGMDPEDGLIWVFGVGDDGIMAFTDFGIENLMELIKIHKENPELLKKSGDPPSTA
jgi:hypothetical protein